MSNLIPTKIITDEGVIAIKNGIKPNKRNLVPVERKPAWLRGNIKTSTNYKQLKKIVHQRKLNTVCEEYLVKPRCTDAPVIDERLKSLIEKRKRNLKFFSPIWRMLIT